MRALVALLAVLGGLVASACVRVGPDGEVGISTPASSVRVGKVEEALTEEQVQRQEGDKTLLALLEKTASDLRSGLDPAKTLAQAKKDAEALDALQAGALAKAIQDSRSGEVPWVEMLLSSLGITGVGAYGVNRYRNGKAKREGEQAAQVLARAGRADMARPTTWTTGTMGSTGVPS